MQPFGPSTILLLVANPVDVITHFAQQYSALPRSRVLGSGTFLDSARLRGALAKQAGVAASSVDAYVLGEHGESQFVAWSRCSVGGVPLEIALPEGVEIDRGALEEETKDKAGKIIESKGATNYGIGGVVARLCRSILFDEREVLCVSSWQEELGVCLSLPVVLGREGVVRGVEMELSQEEREKLGRSAEAIKEVINS
jgi:L-lactate dehydrogenase